MPAIRVRKASAAELAPLLEPLQPATVRALSDLGSAATARRVRAYIAEVDGNPAGALVVGEYCRGRWRASPVLWDVKAAPALARLIDRGPAWEVGGAARHMEPLLEHLRRTERRRPRRLPAYGWVGPAPQGVLPPDPRCRLATPGDLDALVEVFAAFELDNIPTRRRLREFLTRAVAHRPIWIIEADGQIAGAIRCDLRSATFDSWTSTVLPEFRGRGYHIALSFTSGLHTVASGRSTWGVQAETNPTSIERSPGAEIWLDDVITDVWISQPLQSPRRFPGHRRLRRLLERLEGGALTRRRMWVLPFDKR